MSSKWNQNWQQKWIWVQSSIGELSTGTWSIVLPTSAMRNVHVVTWKLDLDQTSVVHTHTENKWDKTCGNIIILDLGIVDGTSRLRVGTGFFLLPVLRTEKLADKLIRFLTTKWKEKQQLTFSKSSWLMITGFAQYYVMSGNCFCS